MLKFLRLIKIIRIMNDQDDLSIQIQKLNFKNPLTYLFLFFGFWVILLITGTKYAYEWMIDTIKFSEFL